jgi:PTH1 family peptidyl-tRNA hydrolase
LRIRGEGSHGGHNGLRSIEQELGSSAYARVRCGVGGEPEGWALEAHVLGHFGKEEVNQVRSLVEQAADAVRCCQVEGIGVAMARYNQKAKES